MLKITKNTFYFPRNKTEDKIQAALSNKEVVYLIGSPKIGKTQLAKHVASQHRQYPIYVDLKYVQTFVELQNRIVKGIVESELLFKNQKDVMAKFSQFNPSINFSPFFEKYEIVVPRLKYEANTNYLFSGLSKNGRKPVVIFDNIEDFLNFKEENIKLFDEMVKSLSQLVIVIENDDVCGKENNSKKLKHYSQHMLEPISTANYFNHIIDMFKTKKMTIDYTIYKMTMDKSGDYMSDNQALFEMMLMLGQNGSQADSSLVSVAFSQVIFQYEEVFDKTFFDLNFTQRSFVRCLAEDRHIKLYGKEFADKVGIEKPLHSAMVARTLDSLVESKILYKDNKEYKFYNPFFKEWIDRNFRY